jgi:hypothetical protein
MSYQKIREILDAIRKFHRQLRRELEKAYPHADDARSKTLLRSLRRGEKEIDAALAQYKNDGERSLDAWIQYVPSEELEDLMLTGHLPQHSSPEQMLKWKQQIDDALAAFYRQLGNQVSDPKIRELLENLAFGVEQRLLNQSRLVTEPL